VAHRHCFPLARWQVYTEATAWRRGKVSGSVASESQQAVGDAWGDDISDERKIALRAIQETWAQDAEHAGKLGPFMGVVLSGADVYWLASQTPPPTSPPGVVQGGNVPDRSDLHLQGANLRQAHLQGAQLYGAHLEGAVLFGAHLEGATLSCAHLERAMLWMARLQGATLLHAHLVQAKLMRAQLDGASLEQAHLEGANLVGATLGKSTRLNGARLDGAALDQVDFAGSNLTVVEWGTVRRLGDEILARWPVNEDGRRKPHSQQADEFQAAARAYRQLANALRQQGLNDNADHFAYRAQVCQRQVYRLRHERVPAIVAWLLDVISGHGYQPGKTLAWYLGTLIVFAVAYFAATHGVLTFGLPHSQVQPLAWYEALVLSVSSFHGRGFFQPVQSLGDPVAILAAAEAVVGLFIEISFIAAFTQRYFGK
jgi:uncharacterized protein YjbI with pentapeptide repeats